MSPHVVATIRQGYFRHPYAVCHMHYAANNIKYAILQIIILLIIIMITIIIIVIIIIIINNNNK